MSSDREWFTTTIAAHGPHLATWVNGIPVADFTNTRLPDDSAWLGYRAKAGVISRQGHDPPTDLSFRNLNIAERGRTRESVDLQWRRQVAPMHKQFVRPQVRWAQVTLPAMAPEWRPARIGARIRRLALFPATEARRSGD